MPLNYLVLFGLKVSAARETRQASFESFPVFQIGGWKAEDEHVCMVTHNLLG